MTRRLDEEGFDVLLTTYSYFEGEGEVRSRPQCGAGRGRCARSKKMLVGRRRRPMARLRALIERCSELCTHPVHRTYPQARLHSHLTSLLSP